MHSILGVGKPNIEHVLLLSVPHEMLNLASRKTSWNSVNLLNLLQHRTAPVLGQIHIAANGISCHAPDGRLI